MSSHETISKSDAAKEAQEKAIMKEMAPFFLYAAIPILFTIFIAWKFGPSM
jgi:hypothetical protein